MRKGLGGTSTADGYIAHLRVHIGGQIIDAPVVVKRANLRGANIDAEIRPLVNEQGRYVHALPGGGRVAGEYKR